MEIKLNGKEAIVFAGLAIANAVLTCVALNKADKAKQEAKYQAFMAGAYKYESEVNRILSKRVLEENQNLKSKLKKMEES